MLASPYVRGAEVAGPSPGRKDNGSPGQRGVAARVLEGQGYPGVGDAVSRRQGAPERRGPDQGHPFMIC